MKIKQNVRFLLLFCLLPLTLGSIWPVLCKAAPPASSPTASEAIKQVVGKIYVAMKKLEGDVFYRHVDMTTVAESLAIDAEALVRGFKKEEMAELEKLSPMLTNYIKKGDLSAAKIAAKNMLTIDTARWFNMSAKGKIVSAFAGDAGLLLKQFHLLAETNDIHYKGIKYIQVQGNKAVVAITIGIDKYHADIQPIGQMELENGVWRIKKVLNAKALVLRIQALDRAQWFTQAKAKQPPKTATPTITAPPKGGSR